MQRPLAETVYPAGLNPVAASVVHMDVLTMDDVELLNAHLTLAELLVRDKENFATTVGLLQLVVQERSRRRATYRIVVVS